MDVATLAIVLFAFGQPDSEGDRVEPTASVEAEPSSSKGPVVPPALPPDAPPVTPEASDPIVAENPPVAAEPTVPAADPPAPAPEPVPEPAPVANDPARATDAELSPIEAQSRADRETRSDYQTYREGGFISLSAGAGHCGTWCTPLKVIGGGRFEAGYRWGYVALGGSVSLVGARFDVAASEADDIYRTVDAKGSTRFLNVGPMLQFFPAARGRFDPYASLAVGFRRVADAADVEELGELKYWEHGFGVTLGAGIPVYVTERVSLGVRYDKSFAVGGKQCATLDGEPPPDGDECEAWSKRTEGANAIDGRFLRLNRPRPWTVALEMRIGF